MTPRTLSYENSAPQGGAIAIQLLKAMARRQRHAQSCDLEALVTEVGVRRAEVRNALSLLHREGYVDVLAMRLTLKGFAVGHSVADATLAPIRKAREIRTQAA